MTQAIEQTVKSLLVRVFPILTPLVFVMALGCSSSEKNTDNAESTYKSAQEFEKEDLYERAIQKYTEVKNKYPYSKFATLAELAIADVHYKDETYPEAQVAYQTFKELHPKHPQIDYVTHRLAMSYFMQLPSTIDRDLTLATSAILYFDEVISKYPNSEYAKEARDKRNEAYRMIAQKEEYVADFYFKQEQYDSALGRYEEILQKFPAEKFPALGMQARTLAQAAISAYRMGDQDKSKKYKDVLAKEYPGSKELRAADSNSSLVK